MDTEETTVEPTLLPVADAAIPAFYFNILAVAMLACVILHLVLWHRKEKVGTHSVSLPDEQKADDSANLRGTQEQQGPGPASKAAAEVSQQDETASSDSRSRIISLAYAILTGIGQAAWALPYAALLKIAQALCAAHAITLVDTSLLTTFSQAMLALGFIVLFRRPFTWLISRLSVQGAMSVGCLRDALMLIASAALSVYVLELPYNTVFASMGITWAAIEFAIALVILVFLYFIAQRFGLGPIIGICIFAIFGIAQHFVTQFKGAAVMPSDLLALGTAAEVGGGYTYEVTDEILLALIAASSTVCLLSFVRPTRISTHRGHLISIGANLCLAAACAGASLSWFNTVDFDKDLDFAYNYWSTIDMYNQQGSLTSFVAVLQDLPIERPENYSDAQAEEIQNDLAASYETGRGSSPERAAAVGQFDEVKPTVIAIMNESFSDLSIYNGLNSGYAGPTSLNSLPDALARGNIAVSVCGGGTANSEFEFLTGSSMKFVGGGKYPYTLYNFVDVSSLAKQFADLGYKTTAMHPNKPNNWNRKTVYRQLGFDQFLSIDDFEGAPTFHNGVSDSATYDKIIELLENNPNESQFIFDVTMQNHGGYNAWNIPPDRIPSFAPAGITDPELLSKLNVYLSCVDESDRALSSFLDRLRTINRPVVVVFFGDHQPVFVGGINNPLFPNEDAVVHSERPYQTVYTIWANYDVAGNDQQSFRSDTSASTLAAQTLDLIGAPLTDAQKAQLAIRDSVPQLNINGYRGIDGTWYAYDADSPYRSLVNDLSRVQYLNFARAVE